MARPSARSRSRSAAGGGGSCLPHVHLSNPIVFYSILAALLFCLLSSKRAYSLTNSVFGKIGVYTMNSSSNFPMFQGIVIHTLVFLGLIALAMNQIPKYNLALDLGRAPAIGGSSA